MPKIKTHKGTAKRVRLSGSGKIMRVRASSNHMLTKKSSRRKRAINQSAEITGKIAKNIKRAIGI